MVGNMTKNMNYKVSEGKDKTYRIIDLFAGIGGIRIGFNNAFDKKAKFVFSSEIDKYAQKTYYENFKETPFGDITIIKESEVKGHDILLAGFPCQAFSIAGLRKGFNDIRGTLFFDVARILKYHTPEVVFLENVKGFVNHDNGKTFEIIRNILEELGYKIYYKVLNSKDFGSPQNRERIYIVGFLNHKVNFNFPISVNNDLNIKDCLEKIVENKYYYNNKPLYEKIKEYIISEDIIYQWRRKYVRENKSGVCPTLTANMGTGGHNVPIIKDKFGIRKLTPRECANFQGFPNDYKLPSDIVDSQLYKQFGNSVCINVVEKIAKNILIALEN